MVFVWSGRPGHVDTNWLLLWDRNRTCSGFCPMKLHAEIKHSTAAYPWFRANIHIYFITNKFMMKAGCTLQDNGGCFGHSLSPNNPTAAFTQSSDQSTANWIFFQWMRKKDAEKYCWQDWKTLKLNEIAKTRGNMAIMMRKNYFGAKTHRIVLWPASLCNVLKEARQPRGE